jgi:hypothetical protein
MKESKTEYIGHRYYCAYCADEAKEEIHWEEYTKWVTRGCDCKGAKLEQEATELYCEAAKTIDHKKLKELQYQDDLEQLNIKYNKNI